MKNFSQLTVGDEIYRVRKEKMQVDCIKINKVDEKYIYFDYDKKIERFKTMCEFVNEYNRFSERDLFYYFTIKTEAIRYAKTFLMKELFAKIKSAKDAINEIKEFRCNNYELLNHDWTEKQIRMLENQLNY